MIQVYQRNTLCINFAFSNADGTPLNLSGYGLYYIAKQNYDQTAAEAPINKYVTGHYSAVSGLSQVTLTTGDTNICAGDYLAGLTLISSGNDIVSTYGTDGLRILANTF